MSFRNIQVKNHRDELVSHRWMKAHRTDRGTWNMITANGRTESSEKIYHDLLTIEDNDPHDYATMERVIGNDLWTGYRCSSCNMISTKPLITFDTASDDPWICMPCLRIAYVKLSQVMQGIEDADSNT